MSLNTEAIYGRYVNFQLTEVVVSRELFRKILSLIDDLRPRHAPAQAGGIDGQEKTTGEVFPDGKKNDIVGFPTRANLQNRAIGWLRKKCTCLGGGTAVECL